MTHRDAPTLQSLAVDLASAKTTSRVRVEECLSRISDPDGEGARTFIRVNHREAPAAADAMDSLRRAAAAPSPFAGIPITVKDLFDVMGEVTAAGSRVLAERPAAKTDATSVQMLRRAGFVIVGRTNMTEFAYSGLGLNPHYGTPLCSYDREHGRAPGGSTSGGAIAVADGMADAALGTDTGGSCRIPAAFNGLTGWKPTARRISRAGMVPLSSSLDSVGVIARSVACCATLDSILSGEATMLAGHESSLEGLRLVVPTNIVLDDLDREVADAFGSALTQLAAAGVRIVHAVIPEFGDIRSINGKGGLSAAESHAWHRSLLETQSGRYDPRVLSRILRGAEQSAQDYIALLETRRAITQSANKRLSEYDALVMPTVPIIPPLLADLQSDDAYGRINMLALRNPAMINAIDGCAISLPIGSGAPPVGLTLAATAGSDARLLSLAARVESNLQ